MTRLVVIGAAAAAVFASPVAARAEWSTRHVEAGVGNWSGLAVDTDLGDGVTWEPRGEACRAVAARRWRCAVRGVWTYESGTEARWTYRLSRCVPDRRVVDALFFSRRGGGLGARVPVGRRGGVSCRVRLVSGWGS